MPVGTLSGGNQQKVVIAKWLMNAPRIILLNDPTRGIDVGTKQEMYQLLRELADEGAAVLFYSTDYAELIGCCDRVAVFYRRPHRALAGGRRAHRARARGERAQPRRRRRPLMRRVTGELPICASTTRHASRPRRCSSLMFALYIAKHPVGLERVPSLTTAANKGVLLALVAMAQTLPVLTAGIDLSVGMVFVLANCLASHLVVGTPLSALGVVAVLAPARCAGCINGVHHRLRPPAADHHDAGDRRRLLRPRALPAAGAGRRRAARTWPTR